MHALLYSPQSTGKNHCKSLWCWVCVCVCVCVCVMCGWYLGISIWMHTRLWGCTLDVGISPLSLDKVWFPRIHLIHVCVCVCVCFACICLRIQISFSSRPSFFLVLKEKYLNKTFRNLVVLKWVIMFVWFCRKLKILHEYLMPPPPPTDFMCFTIGP